MAGNNTALYVLGGAAVAGVGWYEFQGKTIGGVRIPSFPFMGVTGAPSAPAPSPTKNLNTKALKPLKTPTQIAAAYGITLTQLQALNPKVAAVSSKPKTGISTILVVPNTAYPGGVAAALKAAGVSAS